MITDARVLERILTHLGLPAPPPPVAPARLAPQSELTLDEHPHKPVPAEAKDAYLDQPADPQGLLADSRAPP